MMPEYFREVSDIQRLRFGESNLGNKAESFDISSFTPREADESLGKFQEELKLDCKVDDNGDKYSEEGHLLPNTDYELNGNRYTTDDNGRIIRVEAVPERTPENPRDNVAQQQCGGKDRLPTDQGGHIVSRDLGGHSGEGNLVAMDSRINQSDYKRMENDMKVSLDEGKEVTTKTDISYHGDSERPDTITVTTTVDGKDTVYNFDNDLDGFLMKDVPEEDRPMVQEETADTGGVLSSIKEVFDEEGNLVETRYTITYSDENGYHRSYVETYGSK